MYLDALRNELIIGNTYGCFLKSNSYFKVRIGKLSKITDKGKATLTLDHDLSYDSFCDQDMTDVALPKTTSVTPIILFPV